MFMARKGLLKFMTFQMLCQRIKKFTVRAVYQKLKYGFWSVDSILVLERPAGSPTSEFSHKHFEGEIRNVTGMELSDCAAFEDPEHYVPIYQNMLKRGDLVRFGYLKGKCVFRHCLMLSGSYKFGGHTLQTLAPNEAYIHYVFCAPNARGKGFHEVSLHQLCCMYPKYSLYAQVKENNVPSLRGFFQNGFAVKSEFIIRRRFFHSSLHENVFSEGKNMALREKILKC